MYIRHVFGFPSEKNGKVLDNPRYVQHFFGRQIFGGFSMSQKMVVLDHLAGLQTSMELAKALFQNILEKSLFQGLLQDVFKFIPSGELTVCYWKWPIYFVDFPIKNGDFPLLC